MVIRNRSMVVHVTDTVQLHVTFRSLQTGLPADLIAFPTVTIIQPSGNVSVGPTSSGVYHLSTGVYGYDLTLGINANVGVWTDLWRGTMDDGSNDGYASHILSPELKFVVQNTNLPGNANSDGYIALGDTPGFNYTQTELQNINKLLQALKSRLHSSGKSRSLDQFGNVIFIDCDIYTVEMLVTFLAMSLTEFNQIPYFTNITFEDTEMINQFFAIIVQGAVIYALAAKALIERGREFSVVDNGISLVPPTISELLNTQYSAEMANHLDKLRQIKASLRGKPLGLGIASISTGGGRSPAIARLRHLRSRQII